MKYAQEEITQYEKELKDWMEHKIDYLKLSKEARVYMLVQPLYPKV